MQLLKRLAAPLIVSIALSTVLLICLETLRFSADSVSMTGLALYYSLHICLWLSCAFLLNRVVQLVIWDRLFPHLFETPTPSLIRDCGSAVIFLLAISGIVGIVFKQSVAGIWATSGIVGLVVGMAMKNMIADLFTGIAINVDRAFAIGDWVQLHERSQEDTIGQIQEINWRTTHIKTEDNRLVIVPNNVLGAMILTNYSKPDASTRFESFVRLELSVPVEKAKCVLTSAIHEALDDDGLLKSPAPQVLVHAIDPQGVDYKIRYWISVWEGTSPSRSQDAVASRVLNHIRHAGLSVALPKQEIIHEPIVRGPDAPSSHGRVKMLKDVRLFRKLTDDELQKLADSLEKNRYKPGSALISQGDAGDSMFLLSEGVVSVNVNTDNGEPIRVSQFGPGAFFGEMSLLTGEPRSATIKAETPVDAYEINKPILSELFESRPALIDIISNAIAERQKESDSAMRDAENGVADVAEESLADQIKNRVLNFFKGL